VNHYGPTENTVVATCCDIDPFAEGAPPIGRPISNVQAHVLDAQRQPVSVGVPGRLYVGGDSLARGYHHRAQLTAEKFIAEPFSHRAGPRLYDTGDLVRYCEDGNLEFLGRADHQVKVRGYRIELGEIESVLAQHEKLRTVAVIAHRDEHCGTQLVAYLVAHKDDRPSIAEIRDHLMTQLPEYMVPSAFMYMDSLPLTSNGKVDRQALPPPTEFEPDLQYVAPRTKTETELCTVWQEILKRRQVGVRDNFFDLGGHSLLATRVVSRCFDIFRVELSLSSVFKYPTIEQLAPVVDQTRGAEAKNQPAILARARDAFRVKRVVQSRLATTGAND
jgi:hypothetical protein